MPDINFSEINFLAILVSIIIAQVISTIWYTALFGEPWAKAYGASSKEEHTKAIPAYTYVLGLLCTTLLVFGIAILQQWLAIDTAGAALGLGVFVAIGFAVATSMPGYAFLKKLPVFLLALGSQVVMILAISIVLVLW